MGQIYRTILKPTRKLRTRNASTSDSGSDYSLLASMPWIPMGANKNDIYLKVTVLLLAQTAPICSQVWITHAHTYADFCDTPAFTRRTLEHVALGAYILVRWWLSVWSRCVACPTVCADRFTWWVMRRVVIQCRQNEDIPKLMEIMKEVSLQRFYPDIFIWMITNLIVCKCVRHTVATIPK